MNEDMITYDDIKEYESLFTLTPSLLLERFAKRNTNLVSKFNSKIQAKLDSLTEIQRKKLIIVLESDIEELQAMMNDAFIRSNIKQYKILANPEYREFIKTNLDEIRKMVQE